MVIKVLRPPLLSKLLRQHEFRKVMRPPELIIIVMPNLLSKVVKSLLVRKVLSHPCLANYFRNVNLKSIEAI